MKNETTIEKHQRVAGEITELIQREFPNVEEKGTEELKKVVSAFEAGFHMALPDVRVKVCVKSFI